MTYQHECAYTHCTPYKVLLGEILATRRVAPLVLPHERIRDDGLTLVDLDRSCGRRWLSCARPVIRTENLEDVDPVHLRLLLHLYQLLGTDGGLAVLFTWHLPWRVGFLVFTLVQGVKHSVQNAELQQRVQQIRMGISTACLKKPVERRVDHWRVRFAEIIPPSLFEHLHEVPQWRKDESLLSLFLSLGIRVTLDDGSEVKPRFGARKTDGLHRRGTELMCRQHTLTIGVAQQLQLLHIDHDGVLG